MRRMFVFERKLVRGQVCVIAESQTDAHQILQETIKFHNLPEKSLQDFVSVKADAGSVGDVVFFLK